MTLRMRPPGDKSISHRALIFATLAGGTSRLRGLLDAEDVRATAGALRALGAPVPDPDSAGIEVVGPAVFRDAAGVVDCGNSGTSARLLCGLIAGLGVSATLDGDASLRARPMDRVAYPLQAMGARLRYLERPDRLPLALEARASGSLRRLRHRPRVASAQVKSTLLLAGLAARVRVEVLEPGRSRDHTERMLAAMGAPLRFGPTDDGARALLDPEGWDGTLSPLEVTVPADPSSGAFLAGAALLARRTLRLEGLSLNPGRTGWIEVLREMGAEVQVTPGAEVAGEPVGDVTVAPGPLRPFDIGPERIPGLVDEIPLLVAIASRVPGTSRVRGAAELRVKESDRIELLARNLVTLGVTCRERPDGLEVEGEDRPLEGRVETGGDHRVAMAFGVLGSAPGCRVEVDDPACVAVSFPSFWHRLREAAGNGEGPGG